MKRLNATGCESCPAYAGLEQMGLRADHFDRVVALAGIPTPANLPFSTC
jgi:hypothetical protein